MNVNAEQLRAILGFRHPEGMTYFDRLVDEAHVVRAARRAMASSRSVQAERRSRLSGPALESSRNSAGEMPARISRRTGASCARGARDRLGYQPQPRLPWVGMPHLSPA